MNEARTVFEAFAASVARTPHAPFLCTEAVTADAYGLATGETTWGEAAR